MFSSTKWASVLFLIIQYITSVCPYCIRLGPSWRHWVKISLTKVFWRPVFTPWPWFTPRCRPRTPYGEPLLGMHLTSNILSFKHTSSDIGGWGSGGRVDHSYWCMGWLLSVLGTDTEHQIVDVYIDEFLNVLCAAMCKGYPWFTQQTQRTSMITCKRGSHLLS